jgi:hypothetical protein
MSIFQVDVTEILSRSCTPARLLKGNIAFPQYGWQDAEGFLRRARSRVEITDRLKSGCSVSWRK